MLMRRCLNNEMVEEYVVNEIRLEKFPKLRKHFDRFKGKDTARYSREEIFVLMDGLEPQGDNMLQELYETGMLEAKRGDKAFADNLFEIPKLYRIGLGVVLRGRP